MLEVWIAEDANGERAQFDCCRPSVADVLSSCPGFERPIRVFLVECIEVRRSFEFEIVEEDES